jgi:hypothetical protein
MPSMRQPRLHLALLALLTASATAGAQTTSAVRESVFSSNLQRHQFVIQSQGPQGGVIVFSCRADDAETIGVAIRLNKPASGSTTQAVEMMRADGARKTAELMPTDAMFATGAGAAKDLFRWIFEGSAVAFRHAGGGAAGFELLPVKADADRFRLLCNLGK